jgi:hypothetical protein
MEKQNNIYQNLKKTSGFVVLAVPMVLALLGLTGAGVFAGFRQEKALVVKQGNIRAEEITTLANHLSEYYTSNKEYPKADEINGVKVLQTTFGNLPALKKDNTVIYWSDGKTFLLHYLDKVTREEVVIRP